MLNLTIHLRPNTNYIKPAATTIYGIRRNKKLKVSTKHDSSYFNKTKTRVKERKYWRNVFTCVNNYAGRKEESVPQDSVKNMMSKQTKEPRE